MDVQQQNQFSSIYLYSANSELALPQGTLQKKSNFKSVTHTFQLIPQYIEFGSLFKLVNIASV